MPVPVRGDWPQGGPCQLPDGTGSSPVGRVRKDPSPCQGKKGPGLSRRPRGGAPIPFFLSPPRILSLEDLASSVELKSGFLTVADDDQALSRELSEMNIRVSNFASVRGGTVALLGGALFGQAVDPGEVRALYIRTPDTGAPSG